MVDTASLDCLVCFCSDSHMSSSTAFLSGVVGGGETEFPRGGPYSVSGISCHPPLQWPGDLWPEVQQKPLTGLRIQSASF